MGNGNSIVKRDETYDPFSDQTDWRKIDNLTDDEISKAVAGDPDAAPILDQDWFAKARVILPRPKRQLTLRIDDDVVTWFKSGGAGYQSRMNAVLRQFMEAKKKVG